MTLVTHDSVFSRFLAEGLVGRGAVDRVLVERAKPGPAFVFRRLRRVGPVNLVFQYWFARRYESDGHLTLPDLPMPYHASIADINDCEFGPDEVVIGFGTSYVRAATLDRTRRGILNLHTGVLPEYRGVKSEFWAMRRGDTAKLGWTLHYMTPSLDRGAIVTQATVSWGDETPGAMRGRIIADAVERLPGILSKCRTGSIEAVPQGGGAYYSAPTLRDWLGYRRARYSRDIG